MGFEDEVEQSLPRPCRRMNSIQEGAVIVYESAGKTTKKMSAQTGRGINVGGNGEALVRMHLFALIPGQGASQLLRQLADVLGKRSNDSRPKPCRLALIGVYRLAFGSPRSFRNARAQARRSARFAR